MRNRQYPRPLVFTNGCFDIIHRGHIDLLQRARLLGSSLMVAINSDESVRRMKGDGRPIYPVEDRVAILEALRCVSGVVVFEEDTPLDLIMTVKPDVLVKGGDWFPSAVVGATEVTEWGGRFVSVPYRRGISTTETIEKILQRAKVR